MTSMPKTTEPASESTTLLDRTGSAIDRVVSAVSPVLGEKRARARRELAVHAAATRVVNRAYRGAGNERSQTFWDRVGRSADADTLPQLAELRSLSRDLRRNSSMAAGAIRTLVNNAIRGGLQPRAFVDAELAGLTDDQARDVERQLNRLWWLWEPHADLGGRMNFGRMQRLIVEQHFIEGESFVVRQRVTGRPQVKVPFELALDIVDADRVSTPTVLRDDQEAKRGGREIIEGIELNGHRAPVAYWVRKTHPSPYTSRFASAQLRNEWVRVPAYDSAGNWVMRHVYSVERPGLSRGVPWYAPVMVLFKDLHEIVEAELIGTKISACQGILITSENTDALGAVHDGFPTDSAGNKIEKVYPGMIARLGPGDEVADFKPNRPNPAFGEFVGSVLSFIGAGLGIPYQVMTGNFENMNYSNVRAAFVQAWYLYTSEQSLIEEQVCQPTWEQFVREVVELELVSRRLMAAWFEVPDAFGARWTRPGRDSIDPLKEAQADAVALQNLTETVTAIVARDGRDIDEHIAEKADEKREFEAAGLEYTFGKSSDREITKEAGGGDQEDDDVDASTFSLTKRKGGAKRNGELTHA